MCLAEGKYSLSKDALNEGAGLLRQRVKSDYPKVFTRILCVNINKQSLIFPLCLIGLGLTHVDERA